MYYKVIEWIYDNPARKCNYLKIQTITPAIRQAIINDIRINNYIFSYGYLCCMLPLLNTGEVVNLDEELCQELVCEAYNIDEDTYNEYLNYISNEPDVSYNDYYESEYQMKKIVWVTDEAFYKLKDDLLNSNNNLELIPNNYINLKENDIIIFASENGNDYFELNVKKIYNTEYYRISNVLNLKEVNPKSIFDLYNIKELNENLEKISSRYDRLSGHHLYEDFKKTYGTWSMLFSFDEFDCKCDIVIYDKNINFKRTILEAPPIIQLDNNMLNDMKESYNRIKQDELKRIEEKEKNLLELKEKLKEKMKTKKESKDVDVENTPFITLDNISNYFSSEKDDSIETLIENAKNEYELAIKNDVEEKRIMLLNNVGIYFDKIINKNGKIPIDLYINTKEKLLSSYISNNNYEKATNHYMELKEFYNSLDDNTKEKYQIKYTLISLDYVKYLNSINEFANFMPTIDNIFEILYENESDEALFIKSNCHSLLGTIYFEAKKYDDAIDYAYTALVLTNQIENKTKEIVNQYAIFAFNLGNIYFQCDKYDNAIKLFNLTIEFSKEHSFESKLTVFTYSANYLSQVYVCQEEYEKAIRNYIDAISYLEKNFSSDSILDTKIDFLQRIILLYNDYLKDAQAATKYEEELKKWK